MRFLLDVNIGFITNHKLSLDRVMPNHSPLQLGAPTDVSDGKRDSLMLAQHENLAIYSTSNQSKPADIRRVIQGRYVNLSGTRYTHTSCRCTRISGLLQDLRRETVYCPTNLASTSLLYMRVRKHLESLGKLLESDCY